jgi:uncharacterized membrane protein YukC
MGKAVDMSALTAQHEKTRAVGNMNVNARGDIVDSYNRVIQDNTKRVKTTYNNSVGDHLTPPTVNQEMVSVTKSDLVADEEVELTEEEHELFNDDDEEVVKK